MGGLTPQPPYPFPRTSFSISHKLFSPPSLFSLLHPCSLSSKSLLRVHPFSQKGRVPALPLSTPITLSLCLNLMEVVFISHWQKNKTLSPQTFKIRVHICDNLHCKATSIEFAVGRFFGSHEVPTKMCYKFPQNHISSV